MKEKKTNCGIYEIKNIENSTCYIGSSENLKNRKYQHFCNLDKEKHGNGHLQSSYKKYGKDNFVFRPIHSIEKIEDKEKLKKELIKWEQYYIDDYRERNIKLYNIRKKAESNLGIKHTEEFREKCRARILGTKQSEETRNRRSESLKGNKNGIGYKDTEEQRKAKSERRKGKKLSEDSKQKLRGKRLGDKNAMFGKKVSKETRAKMSKSGIGKHSKKVINLTTGEIFNSLTEAAHSYSTDRRSIGAVCNGIHKTCKNCEWQFISKHSDK